MTEPDYTRILDALIGAGAMLLLLETALLVAIWRYCGAHITRTMADAAKRAVDGRLGRVRR